MAGTSSFEAGTAEAAWGPEGSDGDKYIVRHLLPETCCDAPYASAEEWPVLRWTENTSSQEEDEDDREERERVLSVIAGLWTKDSGAFVAFWAVDENDDDHVDFYVREGFEAVDELGAVSAALCTEICPELIDVFDDGSGADRDPISTPQSVFDHELLNNLYSSNKRTQGEQEEDASSCAVDKRQRQE